MMKGFARTKLGDSDVHYDSGDTDDERVSTKQRRDRFEHVPTANRYLELKRGREALRQSYINRGLLQDPNQRMNLADAIAFVGTCQDMCPEYEREEREYQKSVDKFELLGGTTNRIDHRRAVKTYHRSAAGNEQALPCDVRPPDILERTLRYLVNDVMLKYGVEETHHFVRDRMRSIRQDYTLQNERGLSAIKVHEQVARYHIMCAHLLCESENFSESQEMEQLRKVLQSLHEFYEDAAERGIRCDNEAEFRSYHIMAHLGDKDVLRQAQFLAPEIYESPMVQHALRFHALYQRDGSFRMLNASRFFHLVADPGTTFLMACLLEHFFIDIRKRGLTALYSALPIRQSPSIPIERFISMFGFTDHEEMSKFCTHFNLQISDARILCNADSLPASGSDGPLQRRRNRALVEAKISKSLAEYIEYPVQPALGVTTAHLWPPATVTANGVGAAPLNSLSTIPHSSVSAFGGLFLPSQLPFTTARPAATPHTSFPNATVPTGSLTVGQFPTQIGTSAVSLAGALSRRALVPAQAGTLGIPSTSGQTIAEPVIPVIPLSSIPKEQPVLLALHPPPIPPAATATSLLSASQSIPNYQNAPSKPVLSDVLAQRLASEYVSQMVDQLTASSIKCWLDRATEKQDLIRRWATDATKELVEHLLSDLVVAALGEQKRLAAIDETFTRVGKSQIDEMVNSTLKTVVGNVLAERFLRRCLLRRAFGRWCTLFQQRRLERIERHRREQLYRINAAGIGLGVSHCDDLVIPQMDIHVTEEMADALEKAKSEVVSRRRLSTPIDGWKEIDLAERLSLYQPRDYHAPPAERRLLWRLKLCLANDTSQSTNWLKAKLSCGSSGITFLTQGTSISPITVRTPDTCAAIFMATEMDPGLTLCPEKLARYTRLQRERLDKFAEDIGHRQVPILLVFWARTRAAEEKALAERITDVYAAHFEYRRCIYMEGAASLTEFEQLVDWLIQRSLPMHVVSFEHLVRDFSEIFRWATKHIATCTHMPVDAQPSGDAEEQYRKRTTQSLLDAHTSDVVDGIGPLIALFNSEMHILKRLTDRYVEHRQLETNAIFFTQFLLEPPTQPGHFAGNDPLGAFPIATHITLQQLATSAKWIPRSLVSGVSMLSSQAILHELEAAALQLVGRHFSEMGTLFYSTGMQRELLDEFRIIAQQTRRSVDAAAEARNQLRVNRYDAHRPGTPKKPRTTAPTPELNSLQALISSTRNWLESITGDPTCNASRTTAN